MNNIFDVFFDLAQYKNLVSLGTMQRDLNYYYNLNLNISKIFSIFKNIYNSFWKDLGKNQIYNVNKQANQIKLVNPKDDIYTNIVKVDFEKAFTNYFFLIASKKSSEFFKNKIYEISKMYLPRSIKKFFYNYMVTNILMTWEGQHKLMELRNRVYDDLLYACSRYGTIIKSEVDGAYIQTKHTKFPNIDLNATITFTKIQKMYVSNGIYLMLTEDGSIKLKGIEKYTPNIQREILKSYFKASSKQEKDKVIDKYMSNKNYIYDWCIKHPNGTKITLYIKNNEITYNSKTEDDLNGLYKLYNKINKDRYIINIYDHLTNMF